MERRQPPLRHVARRAVCCQHWHTHLQHRRPWPCSAGSCVLHQCVSALAVGWPCTSPRRLAAVPAAWWRSARSRWVALAAATVLQSVLRRRYTSCGCRQQAHKQWRTREPRGRRETREVYKKIGMDGSRHLFDVLGHIHMGTWQVMDAVDECVEINRLILIIFPRIDMTNNRMTKKV